MSAQRLTVLDFTRHEVLYLIGDEATAFQQQVSAQWCTTHLSAGVALMKTACPYCLAEAGQQDRQPQ